MKFFNRNSYWDIISPTTTFIMLLILIPIILILFFKSWFTVAPGERAFVVTFGQIWTQVYDSWFHFKNPLADAVFINVQTQKLDVDATAASKDLQNVSAKITVNYNIIPSAVREIKKNFWDEDALVLRLLQPAIQDAVKSSTAKFTAEELITKRQIVSDWILNTIRSKVDKSGLYVSTINITNFDFSQSFNAAIESKVTAEQEAQRAKNNLSRIEFEWKQKVATALAEKEAAILKAQAEAESIRIQSEAIQKNGWAEYVELKRIEKWNWVLPTMVTNGTPLMNIK